MLSSIEISVQQNQEEVQRTYKGLIDLLEILGISEPPSQGIGNAKEGPYGRLAALNDQVQRTSDGLERCQMVISVIREALTFDPGAVKTTGQVGGINREQQEYWRNRPSHAPDAAAGPWPEDRTLKSSLDPRRPGGTMDY